MLVKAKERIRLAGSATLSWRKIPIALVPRIQIEWV